MTSKATNWSAGIFPYFIPVRHWSLPKPLTIPTVMKLSTLADVRDLVDKHLPEQCQPLNPGARTNPSRGRFDSIPQQPTQAFRFFRRGRTKRSERLNSFCIGAT